MRSDVWVCLPSANPEAARAATTRWHKMGYKVALLLNGCAAGAEVPDADFLCSWSTYPGWGNAINYLARTARLADARVVVGAGDDMYPDPNIRAHAIATQFVERFPDLIGVMQPTGDRWGDSPTGVISERICGSPWMGRNFIDLWNCGRGPFWSEYYHFYADEEMHDVTLAEGILWQRKDLTHHHEHWSRNGTPRPDYMAPVFARYGKDKVVFDRRKASGFPGHRPLGE